MHMHTLVIDAPQLYELQLKAHKYKKQCKYIPIVPVDFDCDFLIEIVVCCIVGIEQTEILSDIKTFARVYTRVLYSSD